MVINLSAVNSAEFLLGASQVQYREHAWTNSHIGPSPFKVYAEVRPYGMRRWLARKLTLYLFMVSSPLCLARQHEIRSSLSLPRTTRYPPGRGLHRALNSFTLTVATHRSQIAIGQPVLKVSIGLLLMAACSCNHYFLFSGVSGLARGNAIISIRYIIALFV
jgi:hypothetical protein